MDGAIIGAGIGGLSTAIAMRKRDIRVRVFEAAHRLCPVGAGILVPPNAMAVLERYGLAEAVMSAGTCIESLAVFDSRENTISETPGYFSKNGAEHPTVAIHRGSLQEVLLSALPSDDVLTGKRCFKVEARRERSEAFFDDGTSVTGTFLVGADGLHSQVRRSIFPQGRLRYSGQACRRGVSKIVLPPAYRTRLSELWGAGLRFGFVPVSDSQVYWYATSVSEAGEVDRRPTAKEELLTAYADFSGPVSDIIAQTKSTEIIRDDIHDLFPMNSWFSESTVLIGDAAHASTPNLGQGGAQAIEDSWVLAGKLASGNSARDAFARFQAVRFPRVERIVKASWRVGQVTNLTNKAVCRLRDITFRCLPSFMARRHSRWLYDVPL